MKLTSLTVRSGWAAVLLLAGVAAGPLHGQTEAPPADRPVLLGGDVEASPPNVAGEMTVRVRYRFEPGTGDNAEVILMPMGRLLSTPRWRNGTEWEWAAFRRVDENTLSAVVPLLESEIVLFYDVVDGFVEEDGVEAMEIPLPTPVSGGGEALRDRFFIQLNADREYDIRNPFPSNLRMQPSPRGRFVVVGEAPAVPGVVRFGPAELVGPPLEPGKPLGWTFWGLWVALAAVLVGYLIWMFRKERSEPLEDGSGDAV